MVTVQNGKGIVASDLHLGQPGATGGRALAMLHAEIDREKPSLIVLNGDTIDGTHPHGNAQDIYVSIGSGINKIHELVQHAVEANPKAQIVYVFGNHDSYHEVRDKLAALAQEADVRGHLHLEESHFRCRDTEFLHGDLQVIQGTKPQVLSKLVRGKKIIEPSTYLNRENAGEFSSWKTLRGMGSVKHALVATISVMDQNISPICSPVKQYANAIYEHFEQHEPNALNGLKRVLMGHIHPPHGTKYQHPSGIEFLVTGASTANSRTSIYSFTVAENELTDFELFSDKKRDHKERAERHSERGR